ncbi:MAG: hypothetical protein NTY07_17110 [Bacteroidia bacterium]|nr:hypothetical protein [Bacteroidia bacterium]
MKNKSLLMTIAILIIAMSLAAQETGTFKDKRDGKKYKTVKIGTQTWMAENLAYKAESGCWAYSNNEGNVATYGYLYDWEAAKKSCPKGWHLPGDAEWSTLSNYLGGDTIAGGKLKETGNKHWQSPNSPKHIASNESGFTGLPGGWCSFKNDKYSFYDIGSIGGWWSSTEAFLSMSAYHWSLDYRDGSFSKRAGFTGGKAMGYSVRCLKD